MLRATDFLALGLVTLVAGLVFVMAHRQGRLEERVVLGLALVLVLAWAMALVEVLAQ